ncbi:MAG: hypothetical protein JWO18_2386 [Microbacteriaceae bacterium]|jgi:hypothetical protein|nr:hypothetical protein [Microbacteriaceae bacterium]
MKQVNYGSETLITGSRAADALIDYAERVARLHTSAKVDLEVLEKNGTTRTHSLLLGAVDHLDIFEVDDDQSSEDEAERFPVPSFPPLGSRAIPLKPDEVDESTDVGEDFYSPS